jgi:hypothetical protein
LVPEAPRPEPTAVPPPETVPTPAAASPGPVPPTPVPARVSEALTALAAGNFEEAAARVRAERRKTPEARELDLIEAAAAGGRYVLEGRQDTSLLATARESLAAFRRKGGSARAESTILSPTLRALLEPR